MTDKNAGNPGKKMNPEVDLDQVMKPAQKVSEAMDKMIASASVDAVYGKPLKQDDYTIIPAAEVLSVVGFGYGAGGGDSERQEDNEVSQVETEPTPNAFGGGGGGGGRTFSRPVAIVVVSPRGVHIQPVIDKTKIGLALLTTVGFMLATIARIQKKPYKRQ